MINVKPPSTQTCIWPNILPRDEKSSSCTRLYQTTRQATRNRMKSFGKRATKRWVNLNFDSFWLILITSRYSSMIHFHTNTKISICGVFFTVYFWSRCFHIFFLIRLSCQVHRVNVSMSVNELVNISTMETNQCWTFEHLQCLHRIRCTTVLCVFLYFKICCNTYTYM